jgi:hypothetical protein
VAERGNGRVHVKLRYLAAWIDRQDLYVAAHYVVDSNCSGCIKPSMKLT